MSLIQWLGPELALSGALKNEKWVEDNCAAAAKMFSDERLHIVAGMMAAVHPHALDYIKQAPVLVAAAARGMTCSASQERKYIVSIWVDDLVRGPKLRDLMQKYQMPQQLRALKPKALMSGRKPYKLLTRLQNLTAMRLAQSIPTSQKRQRVWLKGLSAFEEQIERRFGMRHELFDWAAFAMSRDIRETEFPNAAEIADYAGAVAMGGDFNLKWTWSQAAAAEERWRERLNTQSHEGKFRSIYGIGWNDVIGYSPLPISFAADGFDIIAVNTGAELFKEGQRMRHCVASYTHAVIAGNCYIYSVRVGERRLATLEVRRERFGNFRAVQLKGPCNQKVSAAILNVVGSFMREINGERKVA